MEPALNKNYRLAVNGIIAALKQYNLLLDHALQDNPPHQTSFVADSRKVGPESAFIAYQGVSSDLHDFIPQVIENGCSLVIGERPQKDLALNGVSYLQVSNGRAAWAVLSAALFENPQRQLKVAAISGTNGKTSTVWLLREMLRLHGRSCLAVGTLGAFTDQNGFKTAHTTPDPPLFYRLLAHAVETGVEFCAIEASSHASSQKKLVPLEFDYFGITSFSRDHLDFHKTEEAYWDAKWDYVKNNLKRDARVALGPNVSKRVKFRPKGAELWTYSKESVPEMQKNDAHHLCYTSQIGSNQHTLLTLDSQNYVTLPRITGETPLFADFALENFCCAALGFQKLTGSWPASELWANINQVPGRLEVVINSNSQGPTVVVDYAHTPDALEKALKTTRTLCKGPGKLWVLFGCGGDRDQGKRPQMGQVAERFADRIVLTSDNPRSEDPIAILKDIAAGITSPSNITLMEPDRARAIDYVVLQHAGLNDVVLIAGKGHEDYQVIGKTTIAFDDRRHAAEALNRRKENP